MVVSNISTVPLEDVAKAGGPGGSRWFQLYLYMVHERFRVTYIDSIRKISVIVRLREFHRIASALLCGRKFQFRLLRRLIATYRSML